MNKILLVDDSKDMHLILQEAFEGDYILVSAFDLFQANRLIDKEIYSLILLDVALPDGDGFDFCAKLRTHKLAKDTPVIFLTGKGELSSKAIGFSLGAEDYIVKPFDALEVKLRCSAKVRKFETRKGKESQKNIGDLRFEVSSQRVFIKDNFSEKQLSLTPTGFKLLLYLIENEGQVLSREQLIDAVWGIGAYIVDRTVDTHIGALRKQLLNSCVSIKSVHGYGYSASVESSKAQIKNKPAA